MNRAGAFSTIDEMDYFVCRIVESIPTLIIWFGSCLKADMTESRMVCVVPIFTIELDRFIIAAMMESRRIRCERSAFAHSCKGFCYGSSSRRDLLLSFMQDGSSVSPLRERKREYIASCSNREVLLVFNRVAHG
jgi:hypothetical protein